MTRYGLLLIRERNCSFILVNLEGQVDDWTKVVTFYSCSFKATKLKFCNEKSRRAFETQPRKQCYRRSCEKGAGESKRAHIRFFCRKLEYQIKETVLIKSRREQKSSHNLTGPHNSISRVKQIFVLVFGFTDCMPLLFKDCARMAALILVYLGTFARFCLVVSVSMFHKEITLLSTLKLWYKKDNNYWQLLF